jgi:hypothetical protein
MVERQNRRLYSRRPTMKFFVGHKRSQNRVNGMKERLAETLDGTSNRIDFRKGHGKYDNAKKGGRERGFHKFHCYRINQRIDQQCSP